MKKSLFAVLLCAAMIVSLLPAKAFASDTDPVPENPEEWVETDASTGEEALSAEAMYTGEELPDESEALPPDTEKTDDNPTPGTDEGDAAEAVTPQAASEQPETEPDGDGAIQEEAEPGAPVTGEALNEAFEIDEDEESDIDEGTETDETEDETVDWTQIPPVEAALDYAAPDTDGQSAEELLTAYAQRELDSLSRRSRPTLKAARNLGDSLTGPNAVLYRENKAQIARIAAGELNSARIAVDTAALFGKTSFSAEDLGMDIVVDGRINSDAIAYIQNQIDAGLVVQMLTQDCPYELYWFDKTRGFSFGFAGSYSVDGSGELFIPPSYVISYYVSGDCAPDHVEGGFTTDPTIGWQVQSAVSNIRGIVADAEGLDDLGKLNRYKQEICDRVAYNDSAAGGGYSYSYGNPWQLIWVFDNDSSTNVVCEGYSKAFQYLCDLSSFAAVTCYTVYGDMAVDGSGGGHMWNIVRMPDGRNYLADITNCDSGSIGSPDLLYLKGYASAAGSFAGGDMAYRFSCWGSTVAYTYAPEMFSLFPENDLTLSATDYGSADEPEDRIPGDVNGDGKVNNKDYMALRRFIKYKDISVVETAVDINDDGKVNNKDYMLLRRYIKYHDVEIH